MPSRARSGAVVYAGLTMLLAGAALSSKSSGGEVEARRIVPKSGAPISLTLRPGCRLAGDDPDGQARAAKFMDDFRSAVGNAVGDIEYPPRFVSWQAEVKLVSAPVPPSGLTERVRVIQSVPSLDAALMRAIYSARTPVLPNFRAKCSINIAIRGASKKAVPPTAEQLAGVWIGWEADSMSFFRIDLLPDGTGYVASSFREEPAVLSRITRWSIRAWQVTMQTIPVDVHPNDVMSFSGEVVVRKLELKIVGGKNAWRGHITLHRADEARLARKSVDTRMQAVE
jgi:hypothetical protein